MNEGIPDFDPRVFLAQLQQSAAQERAIAKERPDAKLLGLALKHHAKVLRAVLELHRLKNLQRVGAQDPNDWTWHPAEGSIAHADRMWADRLSEPFGKNPFDNQIELLQRLVASTIDHLKAVAFLMARTNLVRAPISAARSALEATATAAFIIDAEVEPIERLRRGLNLRLLDLGESRRESGDAEHGGIYQELIDQVFDGALAGGLSGKYREANSKALPYLAPKDSTQKMIEMVLTAEVGESVWRNMSSVAHSREGTLILILDSMNPYRGDKRRRTKDVASNVFPALLASHQLIPRLAAYLGWDLDDAADDELTILKLWAAGSGQADESIRQALFGAD